MEYKVHIMQAIKYIEENLTSEINPTDCAQAAGYSNYHFIRIFKEATGLTPYDYIRKRRLTEIVKHMKEGDNIADLAFHYGFNSKENFTRAFVSEHHILPTEYKATLVGLKLYDAMKLDVEEFEVTPKVIHIEPFCLVVYESDEVNPPNFWNKYNSRKWSKKLSGGRVCEDYGVSVWNEEKRRIDYFIGIRKEQAMGNTENTKEIKISGGLYAVFETPRASLYDFVNMIHRTWYYINTKWKKESGYCYTGGTQFETYIEESRTFQEKIYIPIEEEKV